MAYRVQTSRFRAEDVVSSEIELAFALAGFVCCSGCLDAVEIVEPYDPGCVWPCSRGLCSHAHEVFCSETCFENTNDRRAESAYRHAHEG